MNSSNIGLQQQFALFANQAETILHLTSQALGHQWTAGDSSPTAHTKLLELQKRISNLYQQGTELERSPTSRQALKQCKLEITAEKIKFLQLAQSILSSTSELTSLKQQERDLKQALLHEASLPATGPLPLDHLMGLVADPEMRFELLKELASKNTDAFRELILEAKMADRFAEIGITTPDRFIEVAKIYIQTEGSKVGSSLSQYIVELITLYSPETSLPLAHEAAIFINSFDMPKFLKKLPVTNSEDLVAISLTHLSKYRDQILFTPLEVLIEIKQDQIDLLCVAAANHPRNHFIFANDGCVTQVKGETARANVELALVNQVLSHIETTNNRLLPYAADFASEPCQALLQALKKSNINECTDLAHAYLCQYIATLPPETEALFKPLLESIEAQQEPRIKLRQIIDALEGMRKFHAGTLPIKPGVSVNSPVSEGYTPLQRALHNEPIDFVEVRFLLALGADRGTRNREGKTLVDLARTCEDKTLLMNLIFDKKIEPTQEDFQACLQQEMAKKRYSLISPLIASCRGFTPVIADIAFPTNEPELQTMSHVIFRRVTFPDEVQEAHFSDCCFEDCSMQSHIFTECEFKECEFVRCDLTDAFIENCQLEGVKMASCNLAYLGINDSRCERLLISNSVTMEGTNFLESTISDSQIADCDLENCLLFDAASQFTYKGCENEGTLTRPVVGIAWNTRAPGMFAKKGVTSLKGVNSIPLKFNYLPSNIKPSRLRKEVTRYLDQMERPVVHASSIPQELLRLAEAEQHSEVNKLIQRAKNLDKHVHAILLSGSDYDLEPEFYGHEKEFSTRTEADYRRTLLEFAVIKEARKRGIPLMGICRGSQIGNIFYGGTLKQDVRGHDDVAQSPTPGAIAGESVGLIRGVTFGKEQNKEFEGLSIHHQASDQIGEGLELVLEFEGVAKAIEGKQGAPFLLLQFHPEALPPASKQGDISDENSTLSEQNFELFKAFSEAAITYQTKKRAMEELKRPKRQMGTDKSLSDAA